MTLALLRTRPLPQRETPPLRVEGRTLVTASGLRLRLDWSAARSLAEAIHTVLGGAVQVGAYGWVVRSSGRWVELDGRRFDFGVTRLTRGQAVAIGEALAKCERLEVVW